MGGGETVLNERQRRSVPFFRDRIRQSLAAELAAKPQGPPSCVYFLADPRTPRHPRYVGATPNPEGREYQHSKQGHSGCRAVARWKDELRAAGLAPRLIVVAWYPTRVAAQQAEWRLIQRWKRRGLCDCNSGVEGRRQRFALRMAPLHALYAPDPTT